MNPNDEMSADETVKAEDTTTSKPKRHRRKVSPKVLLRVTDEIIDRSVPKSSEHCMVADAVKVAFPTAKAVSVDLATVRFSDPGKGLRYIYLTPRIAQEQLIEFDEGRRPYAFQCELTRAAQIVTMYKRPKGSRKVKVHNLGPKRLQNEYNGRVGTVIGGDVLPTMREPLPAELPSSPPAEHSSVSSASLTPKSSAGSTRRPSRKKRRREFGLRAFKTGVDILISGSAA